MKKPWQKMSEGEQTLEIERATDKAEQVVRDIVDLVAQGDFPVVHAIIDSFQIKDGAVKIVSSGVADDDVLISLNHAGKKAVKIVVADMSQFDKNRSNLKADPDQPGLPGVKLEISGEELRGHFDDTEEPKPTDSSGAEFNDAAEQAEGAAVLELDPTPPDHGPITEMKGFPNGPMQAMRGGVRWWSDDGLEWRAATEDDVLPVDMDDVKQSDLAFEPDESLPGVDELDEGEHQLDRDIVTTEEAGFDDSQDPAPETDAIDELIGQQPAEGEAWPDDAAIAQRTADVEAEGGNADPGTGEVLPLNDAEADEIRAEGGKARANGNAPKANPHPAKSERAKAWLEGYNTEKKAEAGRKPSGDADFDS